MRGQLPTLLALLAPRYPPRAYSSASVGPVAEMAEQIVQDFIKQNKVAMFSKSYCPFCTMAKKCLDEVGVAYKVMEIENLGKSIQVDIMDCEVVVFLQGAVQKSRIIYDRSLENAQFQEFS